MISALLLALAAASQADAPVPGQEIPAFFTGERIYEICRRSNNWQCSMYVAGVIDGVFLTESEIAGSSICRAPLDNRQAAKVVTTYLADHPESRKTAAAVAVRAAIKDRLACDPPAGEIP